MAVQTRIREFINVLIRPLNMELGTLTRERQESARVQELLAAGRFDEPVYTLSPGMEAFDPAPLAAAYSAYAEDLKKLQSGPNDVGFDNTNTFYRTPDMEVLYLLVRSLKPQRIVEIGCGSSTRISRQAIIDGGLKTTITAIDPWPRADIAHVVDEFIQSRLETVDLAVFDQLEAGDVLFIDSSHEGRFANDVAREFCEVIPRLKPGVIVHVHDVFLPFEYPRPFLREARWWSEQYTLHALLQGGRYELLWPGYYVQKMRPETHEVLPFLRDERMAHSFWFKVPAA